MTDARRTGLDAMMHMHPFDGRDAPNKNLFVTRDAVFGPEPELADGKHSI
jgi:hypothetical protein